MTGIDPERLERRLRWAAEQLGLSPDASLDDVRAAWLRRLPGEEFVPSSELRWALAALLRRPSEGGWEARADEAASVAEADRLRGEVEAFAEQFWDFPTDERRRRWEELIEHCAFAPALRSRLRLLEAGLDCEVAVSKATEDARVVELANQIHEMFVLRLRPRAQAQHEILLRIRDDRKAWKASARRLRRAYPKLALLGKDLLDQMATAKPKPKRLPKMPAEPSALRLSIYRGWWLFKLSVVLTVPILISLTLISTSPNRPTSAPPVQLNPDASRRTWEELNRRLEAERRRKQNPSKDKDDKSDGKSP